MALNKEDNLIRFSMPMICSIISILVYLRSGLNDTIIFVIFWIGIIAIVGFLCHNSLVKSFQKEPQVIGDT